MLWDLTGLNLLIIEEVYQKIVLLTVKKEEWMQMQCRRDKRGQ
jgi:hypothetical protein